MSSQYYSVTARVGVPSRHEVEVTIPLVGPQGPAGEAGAGAVESVNGQTGVVVLAAADIGAAASNDARLTDARAPLSHTHGNLTNAGAIGTTSGLPVKTGTSGVLEAGAFGTSAGQFAEGNHTHAASAITSGVLDFDRIQQVVEMESTAADQTDPEGFDLTTNIVGGNLHALALVQSLISESFTKIILPDLAPSAVGKVTVRCVLLESVFVQVVLPDDTAIFPASSYAELDPDEELTFRWNDGRWDMDLRPNASATTAVSIFKPNASGTIALTSDFAAPPAIGSTTPNTLAGTQLALHDGSDTGTFVAASKLSDDRTYDLPDASGTIALLETLPAGGSTNLWIPASAWIPKTTAGCGVDSRETATHDQNFDELLFDTGNDEFADALVIMPSNYNNGTITARFYWTAASGSGGVAWGIQGRAFANDDALDTAAGTAQLVTDTLIAANDMHITSATSAVTIGGTPAANTPIQFTIYRDVSDAADDLGVDARLLGVEILFN
jgi:hypothetical protein